MTLGRNDQCHCGSGKKYKKCCMAADETHVTSVSSPDPEELSEEDDELIDTEPFSSSQMWDTSEEEEEEEDTLYNKLGIPFPDISDEDNVLLDKWYEKIKKVTEPLEQLKAAQLFIDEYPQLVPAWGFEGEYLLDLNPNCVKNGYGDEIYNFLLSFRNRFPGVYQREFGYYDRDLIYHSLLKGKISDIPSLLDNFEQYPDAFPDELFKMVKTLVIKGKSGLLFPFLKKIHKEVINSNKIIDGYEILTPIILHIEGKYIGANISDERYTQMCNEIMDNVDVEMEDNYLLPDYWKQQHAEYFSEAGTFSCNLNKKLEKNAAYLTFLKQFQRFLYETATNDWPAAALISFELCNYISYAIEKQWVKKHNYFVLDKTSLDTYIAQKLKDYLWIDTYKVNALLTGVWYFSEFLVYTGNANEEDKITIRKTCQELHALEQTINKGYIESHIFKKFPMW